MGDNFDVPLSTVASVKLSKQARPESCGLFFPHIKQLSVGLVTDWDGETHLIHLDGPHVFHGAGIGLGQSIRGAIVRDIEFRVDLASRYDSSSAIDPLGALVIKEGASFLFCRSLGDRFRLDPHPVPLLTGLLPGTVEEACGFTRWSIALVEGGKARILRSFEALPSD